MKMIKKAHFLSLFVLMVLGFVTVTPATDLYQERATGGRTCYPDAGLTETEQSIASLTVDALEPGMYRYRFNAGNRNTGQAIWVPVLVLKGMQDGPRLLLTSAVHGDELNGIAVIHGLLKRVSVEKLRGTLVVVPGVNQPGMNANNRHFVGAGGGGFMADLNRLFPGQVRGGSTAERYVARLWQNIFRDNADYAVDLHTQTRGSDYPLFVFSDFRNSTARQMAHDLMPDLIKNDAGQAGTLETAFMEAGVPAVTFEVGGPKKWQADLIERAVLGLENMMRGLGQLEGERRRMEPGPYVGANSTNIYTDQAGFAYIHVALKERVSKGQKLATVVDAFGREKATYYSPHDGVVLSVSTDPLREPGAMLVRILH